MRGRGEEEFRPGTIIGGVCRLEHPIGAGGMGWVWAASHLSLGTPVAVKLLTRKDSLQALARERFRREVRALAELRSPHVVHVYDTGVDPVPYLVMELLYGETLAQRLRCEGTIPPGELMVLIRQAAHALGLAEQRSIVHRDIKPSNLFVASYGDLQILKLLDFGIARLDGEAKADPATGSGVILGSLPYLSPEQIRGGKIDSRSDLWSLAAVMFRALTGEDAFVAETPPEVLFRICSGRRPSATALNPALPPGVDGFFERALAIEPSQRFSSARELAAAFESVSRSVALGSVEPTVSASMAASPRRVLARTESTSAWTGSGRTRSGRRLRRRQTGAALLGFALCAAGASAVMPSSSGAPRSRPALLSSSKPGASAMVRMQPIVTSLVAIPPVTATSPGARVKLRGSSAAGARPTSVKRDRAPRNDDLTPRLEIDPVFGLSIVRPSPGNFHGQIVQARAGSGSDAASPPVDGMGQRRAAE